MKLYKKCKLLTINGIVKCMGGNYNGQQVKLDTSSKNHENLGMYE